MNCYTDKFNTKLYCLTNINPNCTYTHKSNWDFNIQAHIHYLFCAEDKLKILLHRQGAPAIERINGNKQWFYHGKKHREDGPACEWHDGAKYWYYNGQEIDCKNNEEFLKIMKIKVFI